jgi:hypothetical protein
VQEGWNIQAGPNASKIIDAYKNFKLPLTQNNVLGKGDAAFKTAIKLNELLSETLKENSFN